MHNRKRKRYIFSYKEKWNPVIKKKKDGIGGHHVLDRKTKCFLSCVETKGRRWPKCRRGIARDREGDRSGGQREGDTGSWRLGGHDPGLSGACVEIPQRIPLTSSIYMCSALSFPIPMIKITSFHIHSPLTTVSECWRKCAEILIFLWYFKCRMIYFILLSRKKHYLTWIVHNPALKPQAFHFLCSAFSSNTLKNTWAKKTSLRPQCRAVFCEKVVR